MYVLPAILSTLVLKFKFVCSGKSDHQKIELKDLLETKLWYAFGVFQILKLDYNCLLCSWISQSCSNKSTAVAAMHQAVENGLCQKYWQLFSFVGIGWVR